ncbi:hypothetical protein BDV96DRAFT_682568 [Lophiotrema nucula]|uniref:Uncharacterized protein n=1 Tax=Lophiotrema nucula TaxID=690887 RepID=A0A6A5ZR25_9PLEO|nr:hypothetical protein BDV96DRAFT_682568 [Lophiotrema nucula]
MDEALAIVTYAEKRAAKRSPFKRQGALLHDLLSATDETDGFALTQASSAFNTVKATIENGDIIIHWNDKHLTKADGHNDLYFDDSDNRQARVQGLNSPNRKATACGGIMRAFEYDFLDGRTGKSRGKAIVPCSNLNAGALKAFDEDEDITFWRDKDMRQVTECLDFIGRYLSYMILLELFHAVDETNYQYLNYSSRRQAERYGNREITGHAAIPSAASSSATTTNELGLDKYSCIIQVVFVFIALLIFVCSTDRNGTWGCSIEVPSYQRHNYRNLPIPDTDAGVVTTAPAAVASPVSSAL